MDSNVETSHMSLKIFTVAVVALILGGVGGYYYANPKNAHDTGYAQGLEDAQREAHLESARKAEEAARNATAAANPFVGGAVNPFETGYKNPFGDVKTNPFK